MVRPLYLVSASALTRVAGARVVVCGRLLRAIILFGAQRDGHVGLHRPRFVGTSLPNYPPSNAEKVYRP